MEKCFTLRNGSSWGRRPRAEMRETPGITLSPCRAAALKRSSGEYVLHLAHIDDAYNRLAKNIGNDFKTGGIGGITELYSFHCQACGYRNIHNAKQMTCGCGKALEGILVYRKVGDTVIYDMRGKSRGK